MHIHKTHFAMKQIDIIKTYSHKRCLVVDDIPDARTSLKRILVDFGAKNIDTAGSAEEAIDLCERHQYDIVLADHNLGHGKNGQQLLEELRYHRLLKNSSVFMVISAENAIQLVLHTLEYQPDDYVNKPVNRDSLRPRLDYAMLKNETLASVKNALDEGNPPKGIDACKALVARKGKFYLETCKMLGELLCEQHRYEEAEKFYLGLQGDRSWLWAQLGLAKALFGLGQLDNAEQILTTIIHSNNLCLDAHDLLAKIYRAKNKSQLAQLSLGEAVKISPHSVQRQRDMGRICSENNDLPSAVHAYRQALKLARNSCHEQPEDYINLVQTLTRLSAGNSVDIIRKLAAEALDILKLLNKKYGRHPVINTYSKLLEANVYDALNNSGKSDELARDARQVQSEMKAELLLNTSMELCIGCARAFMARGQYDEGEHLLQEIAKINTDPAVAVQLDKLLREPVTGEGIQYAAKLNKQGIEYYQAGEIEKAVRSFESVLKELPNHIGLNLNLIQAMISKNKECKGINDKEIAAIQSCFRRIGEIKPSSSHSDRYQYLMRQFEKLHSPR